jgi:hypothetical protein
MALRGENNIAQQLRDVLLGIDELNSAQQVGTNQIVAKPYETEDAWDYEFTVDTPFQTEGSSYKVIKITVTPEDLTPGNILLSNIIPELRFTNGNLVSSWDFVNNEIDLDQYFFIVLIDSEDDQKNTYLLGITALTGTVMRLKVHITANATTSFTLEDIT